MPLTPLVHESDTTRVANFGVLPGVKFLPKHAHAADYWKFWPAATAAATTNLLLVDAWCLYSGNYYILGP